MTRMSESTVRLRPPFVLRAFGFAFLLVWFAVVALTVGRRVASGATGPAIIAGVLLVAGMVIGYRVLRVGLDAHGSRLIVRNHLYTRTLDRSEIEDFRLGKPPGGNLPIGKAVYIMLANGSVLPVEATGNPLPGKTGRALAEEHLKRLRNWHASRDSS